MLKIFLLLNCATCGFFGALFASKSHAVASFIGTVPPTFILAVGLILLFNATLLGLAAQRWPHNRLFVGFFVLGDASWVALTLALLAAGVWISGGAAVAASSAVALMVGTLGFGQWYFGLRK
jgi:hypothetical protein